VQIEREEFTPELLQRTTELLNKNPEYYTVWNHRRRLYDNEFRDLTRQAGAGTVSEEQRQSQVLDILQLDLQFLFPLLLKFPKCYWIWNHRLWLLDQSTLLLPRDKSLALWSAELGLVGKMLTRDSRNFHGWGYRRVVITNLESLSGNSMAKSEFDYTTKMISANLSNFSAWHNRSKLIIRTLDEQQANTSERKAMLDEELKLIHKALFDPYDQSLWFYHQNLMCCLDPVTAPRTMAPGLTSKERLVYVTGEREFVEELLEDTDDCKWIYQSLIELASIEARLMDTEIGVERKAQVKEWLGKLKSLDSLRACRWNDLEQSLMKNAV
jgi:geranylgeranyl transferase type-2 subunit alpha